MWPHRVLTGIRNLNTDATTLEGLSIQCQSLHETLTIGEFSIGEALGPLLLAILDNADTDDIASLKEFGDRLLGSIV